MAFVHYLVPEDVDAQILRYQAKLASERNVKLTKVTKSGDVLREWASIVKAVEQSGIVPAVQTEAQP